MKSATVEQACHGKLAVVVQAEATTATGAGARQRRQSSRPGQDDDQADDHQPDSISVKPRNAPPSDGGGKRPRNDGMTTLFME